VAFDRMLGEAYILMRADGTLIPRDVKNISTKGAKQYSKAWNKELKGAEKGSIARFRKALALSTADIDFSRFRKEFGSVDQTVDGISKRLKKMRRDNLLTFQQTKRIKEAVVEWGQAQNAIADNQKRIAAGQRRLNVDVETYGRTMDRINRSDWSKMIDQWARAAKSGDFRQLRNDGESLDDMLVRLRAHWEQHGDAMGMSQRQLNDFRRSFREWRLDTRRQEEQLEALAQAQADLNREVDGHSSRWVRSARTTRLAIDRVSDRADHMGEIVGRAFGKGSRNNFVNWVGSMVGGLLRLGTAVVTFPLKAISHIGDSFGTAFSAARAAGIGRFASAGRGLLAVFGGKGGIIGAIVGLGAAGFAFGKLLPGIISLLTMVGGAVSALAGSISIGLVGALLAVGPAAVGAIAGLGGLASVFVGFFGDEKNKKFVDNFLKPFKDMNKSYYPEVRKFLTNIRSGFDDVIRDIKPSIDTFFTSFQSKMNDPTTRRALTLWSDAIGRIATSLSGAGTSLLSGLAGFFVPILPYAEKLANYIERAFATFDKWANSVPGQNSIAVFMEKAWINAKKVWDILGSIAGIIGSVFTGGNETGTGFLEGIRKKLEEIDGYLKTPEGKSRMEEFFGDVKGIGASIGTLAVDVGKIIKELNSPEGRQNAQDIMDAIVGIADMGVKLASVADSIGSIMGFLAAPIPWLTNQLLNGGAGKAKDGPKPPPVPFQPSSPFGDFPSPATPVTPAPGRNPFLNVGPTKLPSKSVNVDVTTSLNGTPTPFTGGNAVAQIMAKLGLSETQQKQLAGWVVPVTVNDTLAKSTMRIIEAFRFTGKQVPVDGNEAEWNVVKGTVAGYAFDPKTVKITANAEPAKAAIDNVKRWLDSLPNSHTIRIAGVNSVGGITMASGGVVNRATFGVWGEAGAEALVPLDRPLSQVDPSVRALSAIAQGMNIPKAASGGVFNGGSAQPIVVEEGAVQVITSATSAVAVARVVDNSIRDALVGAMG
jgi:hypothetical protein